MTQIPDCVLKEEKKYYTINLEPGNTVYGENIIQKNGFEYRHWDPNRSKLGAFLEKTNSLPLRSDMNVLYLGAGDGTTVSHVSDILTDGKVYAVEKARKPYRNLLNLSKRRKNIFPIMEDAGKPRRYEDIVEEVDFLYQDIAQRDQVGIFLKNLPMLKENEIGMLALKARSIDVTEKPSSIYSRVEEKLRERTDVLDRVDISGYQKDHAVIVIRN